ncbi:hypothetical protein A4D02_31845 [Niastella koreensis]|uniref:DUF2339 domain-containing protein n=2 Tax=Niastella koreensis TaxID=354356 RepID=G8T9T1_NIAKG|nr:DUF2339 domain-containing protein [Niastella koreensis]AEW01275.1 Protein of unknown function DUF2339, transmembrane [Niastella koreensis GR20-10]OQP46390.1 hypothetical protein A4D02_31845 [Niastella koreensis]
MDKNIHERIELLSRRIQELAGQQTLISNQLVQLINELEALKRTVNAYNTALPDPVTPIQVETVEVKDVIEAPSRRPPPPAPPRSPRVAAKSSSSFEEFIGKNVASKVGILVTIIGIFIGSKYAIEHNMVSPIVRITTGYISGIALVAIGIWLKKKYEAYSSVLMGGGLAVLYFITYTAYSFYHLLPQPVAFAMMLVFTAGTVYAALLYNRVIIAHLAQVGAYAIPFLLSDNSGRYAVFFGYVAIINTGILVVSLRKYWKSLFYSAFILTWFIYGFWYITSFSYPLHKYIAWTYLVVFFLIFYATFLAYKIIKKEQYGLSDVLVLLSNAFIFYGIGYNLINYESPVTFTNYAGAFTLVNAAIHLTVSQVIRRLQLADRSLYYLLLGLVIVFCTIAIPVQLDGNWVTLLWTAEAVLVFLIGRMRRAGSYEKLGAGLAILSFLSLAQDWFSHAVQFTFSTGAAETPFINIVFATGLLVAIAQGAMIYYNRNKNYQSTLQPGSLYLGFYNYFLPAIFLVTTYFTFYLEISGYFRQLEKPASYVYFFGMFVSANSAFAFVVLLLYSMVFSMVVMMANQRWGRSRLLAMFSLTGIGVMLLMLVTQTLAVLNELTHNYYQKGGVYFGALEFYIRYIVIVITALLLYTGQQTMNEFIQEAAVKKAWTLTVYGVVLAFISAEYLCWTSFSGAGNQYKLGLSVVWGLYALMLIVLGIQKKQKHLRLAAIVLFMVTLIKLFFYDLADSSTITKTISFISLGVLLLVVSFLYNKYKEVLFGDGDGRA